MIPAGTYRGKCTGVRDVKFGKTANGGEQIGLLFEIIDGEYRGARIAWYGSLTSTASIQFVRNVLLTCGWDGGSWTNLRGIDRRAVSLVVEEERDPKGVIRPRLKYINAETSVMMKEELSADEVSSLLDSLDRVEGDAASANGRAAGAATPAQDDVAF